MATKKGPAGARTEKATEVTELGELSDAEDTPLKRGDPVTVNDKPGRVTGFRRAGGVYVRFDEKGAGLFPVSEITRR